jgi:V8-like Glu-specific endopeptidase
VEIDSGELWNSVDNGSDNFKCRVIATLYRRKNIDVSILKSIGYQATTWIPIDTTTRLAKDFAVDILGYPGDHSLAYLSKLHHLRLGPADRDQLESILPHLELIVSHGNVLEANDRVFYRLSTTGGMSGGPVIYNGKAVGNIWTLNTVN